MKRPLAFIATVAALAFPAGLGMVSIPAAAETTPSEATSSEPGNGNRKVEDAQFTWGLNQEAGSGGFAPGTCNFLSAGAAGNAGSSGSWNSPTSATGQTLFRATDGNVTIEKLKNGAKDQYQTTSWDEKCTASDGTQMKSPTGKSSGNRVNISGGTGVINPGTDTGTIQWKGSFTVVFYSGYTYWTISDPTLQVTNGHGKLTGTYSGYGASMQDPTKWEKLDSTRATIANFQNSAVDLTENGFTVTPDYKGVKIATSDDVSPQLTDKSDWGSFPQDWINYNIKTGQSSYWYTSGGQRDQYKVATPVTAVYSLGDKTTETPPIETQAPTTRPATDEPTPNPTSSPAQPAVPSTADSPTLYWGINNEANSGAFFGVCNFLVAGESGDNGKSTPWKAEKPLYKSQDGNVTIEKPDSSGNFKQASWSNKCADRNGDTVSVGKKNSHTESRMTIKQGVRTDSSGGFNVKWRGSATIAFYGGMTYWTIHDPELAVNSRGVGKMTATATGFGADMDNADKWEKLAPQKITMADFTGVNVEQAKSNGGFTVTPRFEGVKISDSGGRNPQDRKTKGWGSFPSSWVDFNMKTGQSSYWYTSGGQRDYAKPAVPMTIALKAGYTPGESDYNGQSDGGAAQNPNQGAGQNPNQGAGQNPNQNPNAAANPAGSNGAGNNGAANKADAPNGADDDSAFAPTAAQARAENTSSRLTPAQWAGAGAIGTGALALTGGTGWFLRRRVGLDPTTWT